MDLIKNILKGLKKSKIAKNKNLVVLIQLLEQYLKLKQK